MTKLTASICCFALSGLFAWVSATTTASLVNARAHATQEGFVLLLKQPTPDYSIAAFSMWASVAMLVIGIGCLVACMFKRDRSRVSDT